VPGGVMPAEHERTVAIPGRPDNGRGR